MLEHGEMHPMSTKRERLFLSTASIVLRNAPVKRQRIIGFVKAINRSGTAIIFVFYRLRHR